MQGEDIVKKITLGVELSLLIGTPYALEHVHGDCPMVCNHDFFVQCQLAQEEETVIYSLDT